MLKIHTNKVLKINELVQMNQIVIYLLFAQKDEEEFLKK